MWQDTGDAIHYALSFMNDGLYMQYAFLGDKENWAQCIHISA